MMVWIPDRALEPEMQAHATQRSQHLHCGVTVTTTCDLSMHHLSGCEGLCDSIFDHGYRC